MASSSRLGFGVGRISKTDGREEEPQAPAPGERRKRRLRSDEFQQEDARRIGRRHDVKITEWASDWNVSGATMDRKGLNEGIQALRDKKVSVLVFARLDRYSRETIGGLKTLELIEELGGSLLFGDCDVDTSTPSGRQLFTIMLSNAQREREERRDGMTRAARAATMEGIRIAPPPPGYKLGADRRLKVDRSQGSPQRLIRPLFERRAGGEAWSSLRRWWHERTGEWRHIATLQAMIANPTYKGELHYGTLDDGETPLISPHRHTALVDEQLWNEAQYAPAPRPPRSVSAPSLLAGIAWCSGCGHPMTAGSGPKPGYEVYMCQSRATTWTCERRMTITQRKLDPYVVEQFLAWADAEAVTTGDRTDDFAAADAAVAAAETELAAYLERVTGISPARARAGAESREQTLEEAIAARKTLDSERVIAGVRYRVTEEWPSLTTDERRQLLHAGIARVVIHPSDGPGAGTPVAARAEIVWRTD